jgi:hypothetical protein
MAHRAYTSHPPLASPFLLYFALYYRFLTDYKLFYTVVSTIKKDFRKCV